MALKLYLADAAPVPSITGLTAKGTWNDSTNISNYGGALTSPSGASASFAPAEVNASPTWTVVTVSFSTPAAGRTFTMGGTVQWVIPVQESSSLALMVTRCHIWVAQGSTNTLRGTLLSNFTGTTTWPTTGAGLSDGPISLSEVAMTSGDIIVFEFGYQAQNSSTTSFAGTQWFGSSAASPDLGIADTNVTSRPSFVQFSTDFTAATAPKAQGGNLPILRVG